MFLLKSRSYLIPIFFAAILFTTGCSEKKTEDKSIDRTQYTDTISVETAVASINDIKLFKTFSGNLEGIEQANIYAKIPERITGIRVKVGDYVSKGSTIIEIDKAGASSQFYQAQAAFLSAERELNRMKSLFEAGAISKQMLDGLQTQFDVAKANFNAVKSTIELTSPISGYVTALNVNPGDLAVPGIILATVADLKQMKVIFNVGETDVPSFYVGQPVEIYSELKPDQKRTGKINQISKSAQVASRTFEMKALFPNTGDNWFRPGMFCKVDVELKTQKGSLTIPNSALITNNTTTGVFVITDNKSYFRNIKTGITNGVTSEVLSGLNAGDTVVTLGMDQLKEGSVVNVQNK